MPQALNEFQIISIRQTHVTTSQAAKMLCIRPSNLATTLARHGIKPLKLGKAHWFNREELQRLIDGKRPEPPPRRPNDPQLRHPLSAEEITDFVILTISGPLAEQLADGQAITAVGRHEDQRFENLQITPEGLEQLAQGLKDNMVQLNGS